MKEREGGKSRMEERLRTKIFPRPYVHILRKMKRINPVFIEESNIVANSPVWLCLPAFKVRLRGHLFQEPSLNFHTGLRPCSGLAEFSEFPHKAAHTLFMDQCPQKALSFLRTHSLVNSFSSPLGQEQCAEQRRHLLNTFVIELKKKIKVLLYVKIQRKK